MSEPAPAPRPLFLFLSQMQQTIESKSRPPSVAEQPSRSGPHSISKYKPIATAGLGIAELSSCINRTPNNQMPVP